MRMLILQPDEAVHGIGSRYISSLLKSNGHQCTILFCPRQIHNFETEAELQSIERFIETYQPDLIGFSFMSGHFPRVQRITDRIRKSDFAPIIYGGVHSTCAPEHALKWADAVCVGEAENVILKLADAFDHGGGFQEVPGIFYNSPNGIVRQPPPERFRNLDHLPFPDYHGHYILENGQVIELTYEVLSRYKYFSNGVHFIMTSRGCPGTCSFCCNPTLKKSACGPWLRRRSVDSILCECKSVLQKNGFIEGFAFWDDSLLACSDKWLEDFCSRYQSEIGLPFLCNLNPNEVTAERIQLLTDAGLSGIQMGLQTGSDRVNRHVFSRRATSEEFIHADMVLNQFKDKLIDRYYHLISDNPWETVSDQARSFSLLNRLKKPYYLSVFSLVFYPGTHLHKRQVSDFPELSDDNLGKDFFDAERNFVNRLLRATPVLPYPVARFFWETRHLLTTLLLFNFYYATVFVPFHRKRVIRRYYNSIGLDTGNQETGSADPASNGSGYRNRFWPSLKFRPR